MGIAGAGIAFAPRLGPTVRPRDRLLTRLDDLEAHPVVILRAPGGGGKSTALAAWAARSTRPGVWLTLDAGDSGRLGFWRRVTTAILDAGAIPAGGLLNDLVIGEEIADRLHSALLRAFAELPDRFVIVVDDYHLLTDERVHDDIVWLLEAGARVDFRLATRAATPFERPDRLARLDARVVGHTELAFERAETQLAADAAGLERGSADALHDAFGGWPLAIQSTLVELEGNPTATVSEALERVRTIGLRDLLVAATDSEYLLFLLRTSVPKRLSPDLAVELGGDGALEALRRAEQDGFGTWVDDGARAEFAYQPHLRHHLQSELERRLPSEVDDLRATYARDRLKHEDALEAVRQFAAIRDWDGVTAAVRTHYLDLVSNGSELTTILRAVDPAALRRQPILLAVSVVTENAATGVPRARLLHLASLGAALIQARLGVGDPRDRAVLLLALLAVQRIGGHHDQAVATAERLLAAASSLDGSDVRELRALGPRVWLHAATTFLFDGQLVRAEQLLDVAAEMAIAIDRPWTVVHAEGLRLAVLAEQGDIRLLEPLLRTASARTRPYGWRGTYSGAGYHFAAALAALERFDAPSARTEVDALHAHEATIEHWPIIARLRALVALVEGEAFPGLTRLERDIADHDQRPPTSRTMSALLSATRSDLLLAAGEPLRARAALRGLRRNPDAALAGARVALALGRAEEAIAAASGVAWDTAAGPRLKAEAFLTIGVAATRAGRAVEARDATLHALELLDSTGLRRPLMMLPRAELGPLLDAVGSGSLLDGVPDVFPARSPADRLTPAEVRVLGALQDEGRIDDIAARLYLSSNTIKVHLRNVYRKLGVSSREEALAVGHLRGLLVPEDPE